jgi:hypothetical protein
LKQLVKKGTPSHFSDGIPINSFMTSDQLEGFFQMRDQAIEGLVNCDVMLNPTEIENLGFVHLLSENVTTDRHEYFMSIYKMNEKKLVYIQVEVEMEGGMTHESLFADEEIVDQLHQPLVEKTLRHPTTMLAETIFHFQGIKIPGKQEIFQDNSIFYQCHHYRTIAKDPVLSRRVLEHYLQSTPTEETEFGVNVAERKALVIKALKGQHAAPGNPSNNMN